MQSIWNHIIKLKEEFIPKKGKVYLLLRKEREKICEFIEEKLRK